MAKRTVVVNVCDMPHSAGGEDIEGQTVTLVTASGTFELELCDAHMTDLLLPMVRAARRVRGGRAKGFAVRR